MLVFYAVNLPEKGDIDWEKLFRFILVFFFLTRQIHAITSRQDCRQRLLHRVLPPRTQQQGNIA